jgi:hypothetical protein
MDFETNFDKALLNVGQAVGQETLATPDIAPPLEQDLALDTMLLQELGEVKGRESGIFYLRRSLKTGSKRPWLIFWFNVKTIQRTKFYWSELDESEIDAIPHNTWMNEKHGVEPRPRVLFVQR